MVGMGTGGGGDAGEGGAESRGGAGDEDDAAGEVEGALPEPEPEGGEPCGGHEEAGLGLPHVPPRKGKVFQGEDRRDSDMAGCGGG